MSLDPNLLPLVVCGAHLSGMALNHQLTARGATLVAATSTAPCYRLYVIEGPVRRPGLIRTNSGGSAIAVEIWQLPASAFGGFLAGIAPPLGLGSVLLADGSLAIGFICEAYGVAGATEITAFGGWRNYIASLEGL